MGTPSKISSLSKADLPNAIRSRANLLEVRNLTKSFGGVRAVAGLSFSVPEGSITGLIGPNGAGKSTAVDCISGFHHADSGEVICNGQNVIKWPPHKIAQAGMIRTFQLARELQKLTVLENLLLAPQHQAGATALQALWMGKRMKAEEEANLAQAVEFLQRFNLYHVRDEYAGNLSGGQKKLLDLARALMVNPRLVLLDEPMAGVNPSLAVALQEHIRDLMQQGITFLLIEHNLNIVESLCQHVVVMAEGRVLAEGQMSELRANDAVVTAYLGR